MQLFVSRRDIVPIDRIDSHSIMDRFQLVGPISTLSDLALMHLRPHGLVRLLVAMIIDFFLALLGDLLVNSGLVDICIVFVDKADTVALISIEVIVCTPLQGLHIFCDALTFIFSRDFLVVALLSVIFYLVFIEGTHLYFVLSSFHHVSLVLSLVIQLILQRQHVPHPDFIAFLKCTRHMRVTFLNGGFKS